MAQLKARHLFTATQFRKLAGLLERKSKLRRQLEKTREDLNELFDGAAVGHTSSWNEDRTRVTGLWAESLAELAKAGDMEAAHDLTDGLIAAPVKGWKRSKRILWLYYRTQEGKSDNETLSESTS